jgi:hypothetical protein
MTELQRTGSSVIDVAMISWLSHPTAILRRPVEGGPIRATMHALVDGRSMRSALIIMSLAALSCAPCSAERLFSTPLMDAAVNHDLAKVRKLEANVAPRTDANAAGGQQQQGEAGSPGSAAKQLAVSPQR